MREQKRMNYLGSLRPFPISVYPAGSPPPWAGSLPAAERAEGSVWAAVTGPTEPGSAVHIKALFAGVAVKPLIAWLTLTLPCGLVAAIHIQASNHRAVTDEFCKGKKETDIH